MQLIFLPPVSKHSWRQENRILSNIITVAVIMTVFLSQLCEGTPKDGVDKKMSHLSELKTALAQQPQDIMGEKRVLPEGDTIPTSKVVNPNITSVFGMVREAIAQLRTESSTGRTFFLFPIVATMAPMFLAQMSGVALSILPVTTLLIIPALLLPLGLTLFVYWV